MIWVGIIKEVIEVEVVDLSVGIVNIKDLVN